MSADEEVGELRATWVQRTVLGVTAVLVALRLIFPVQYVTRDGLRIDILATVLSVVGLLVLGLTTFVLAPSLDPQRLRVLLPGTLLAGWFVYLVIGGIWLARYGIPASIRDVGWLPAGAAAEALLLLLWLTAVWTGFRLTTTPHVRRKWVVQTLVVFLAIAAGTGILVGQRYWAERQILRAQEQKVRQIVASLAAKEEAINLVQGHFELQIRAALAGATDDLTLRGWETRELGKGRYLVGYTFTLPEPDVRALLKKDPDAPLIFLPCSRHLPMVDVAKGSNVLGWWWEVVPSEKLVVAVNDVPAKVKEYDLILIARQC